MTDPTPPTYTAVILGAGQIGASMRDGGAEGVWTHAQAWRDEPRVTLAGIVDLDEAKAVEAGARWGAPAGTDAEAMLAEVRPDIVSVCVPNAAHESVMLAVLEHRPRLVVGEKPLAPGLAAAERIVQAYEEAGVGLLVNLSRRFDDDLAEAARALAAGEHGRVLHAVIRYAKGIVHNGIHAVDCALNLFGPCLEAEVLGTPIHDFDSDEPTLSARLACERCEQVLLLAADERAFSIFEIDVLTERGRIVFDDFGFQTRQDTVRPHPTFPGYRDLQPGTPRRTRLPTALGTLAREAVGWLDGTHGLRVDGRTALAAERVCHGLRRAAEEQA